jgi:hypothetical protein
MRKNNLNPRNSHQTWTFGFNMVAMFKNLSSRQRLVLKIVRKISMLIGQVLKRK